VFERAAAHAAVAPATAVQFDKAAGTVKTRFSRLFIASCLG